MVRFRPVAGSNAVRSAVLAYFVEVRDRHPWPEWVRHYQRVIDRLETGAPVFGLPAHVVRDYLPGSESRTHGYWDLGSDDSLTLALRANLNARDGHRVSEWKEM